MGGGLYVNSKRGDLSLDVAGGNSLMRMHVYANVGLHQCNLCHTRVESNNLRYNRYITYWYKNDVSVCNRMA